MAKRKTFIVVDSWAVTSNAYSSGRVVDTGTIRQAAKWLRKERSRYFAMHWVSREPPEIGDIVVLFDGDNVISGHGRARFLENKTGTDTYDLHENPDHAAYLSDITGVDLLQLELWTGTFDFKPCIVMANPWLAP